MKKRDKMQAAKNKNHTQKRQTNIQKYLARYADELLVDLDSQITQFSSLTMTFDYVIVIPACDELVTFERAWESLKEAAEGKSLLGIVVVNENDSHHQEIKKRNQELLSLLKAEQEEIFFDKITSAHRLLVIDCTGEKQLSAKEGVGRARKIGCDIALYFIEHSFILNHFIFCSDADVIFPADYFSRVDFDEIKLLKISALIYPFKHVTENNSSKDQKEAIAAYDLSIRLYVLGLDYAQSPYAFTTIGSTLAISSEAYAQVRGIPKRAAGEDFYMLNKLIAVGPIYRLFGEPLLISGRESRRAPFGTGPAVSSILEKQEEEEGAQAYWPCDHPQLFILLRDFLQRLEHYAEVYNHKNNTEMKEELSTNIFGVFKGILKDSNWLSKLERDLATRRTFKERLKAAHTFFDALKTLRLLHQMRDRFNLLSLSAKEVLEISEYIDLDIEIQNTDLLNLQTIIAEKMKNTISGEIALV